MVPEDQQEKAALSASTPAAPGSPTVVAEVAESTEVPIVGTTRESWADLSDEAPAVAGSQDLADFPVLGGEQEEQLGSESVGEAAFGASDNPPEEDTSLDALEIIQSELIKDEEDAPIEDSWPNHLTQYKRLQTTQHFLKKIILSQNLSTK